MRLCTILLFLLVTDCAIGQTNWARRVGSWSNDVFNAMVIDANGNTYVAGEFGGSITLGTGTITSQGSLDIIIARYDPAGQLVWVKTFGSTGLDRGIDLALGPAGELVVTGVFMGTVQFDGLSITSSGGTLDMFLLRMTTGGTVDWVRKGGGAAGADQPNSVSVGSDGMIAVTGEFFGTAVFDAGTITSMIDPNTNQPSIDIFVTAYDAQGNALWLKHGAAKFSDRGITVAHDLAGNVYVAGQFSDTITFDVTHNNAMYSAVFIIRFDPLGNEEWFRVFGGGTYTQVFDMALVGGDRMMLVGDIQGTAIFLDSEPNMFTAVAPRSSFIVEVDLDGEFIRQKTWGSEHVLNTRRFSVKDNEVIVLGRFQCQFTGFSDLYGDGTWLATGQHDLYVARFHLNDLQFKDAQQFGGQGNKVPGGIVHTLLGNPLFCGAFAYLLVFPSHPGQFTTTPIQNVVASPGTPGNFCDDPSYGSYVGLRGSALMDAFIAEGFAEDRSPYDMFARPSGPCDRPQRDIHITLNSQGVTGPDSLAVCNQGILGVRTHTAFNPDTAVKHTAPILDYLWNTGDTTVQILVNTSGWYSVVITSTAGCWERQDSLYVTVNPLPDLPLVSDDVVVNSATMTPASIIACEPLTPYLWVTGVDPQNDVHWVFDGTSFPGDTIHALQGGIYGVVVTSPAGCTVLTNVQVTPLPVGELPPIDVQYEILFPQDLDLNDTIHLCENQNLQYSAALELYLNGVPTTLPYGVVMRRRCSGGAWSSPMQTMLASCSRPVAQEGWVNVTMEIMLTNAPCGEDTLIFFQENEVYVIPLPVTLPTVSVTAPANICPGDTATAYMTCTDCDNITWSGSAISQSFVDSAWVTSQGGITVQVSYVDTNGCSGSASAGATVLWNPNPQLNVIPVDGIICPDSVATIYSDSQGLSYQWYGPFGPLPDIIDTITTSDPGLYYLEMVDMLSCLVTSDPVLITDFATPYLNVLPDNMLCEAGETAILQVITTSESTLEWQSPLSGNAIEQIVDEPGIYSCTVHACGITTLLSVEIFGNNAVADLVDEGPYQVCTGDGLLLEATPGMALYYWVPDTVIGPQLWVQQPGVYTLIAVDVNGCMASTEITVISTASIPFDLGLDTLICPGDTAEIHAPPGYTDPLWSGGGTQLIHHATEQGSVVLTATDANGCTTSDSLMVLVYAFAQALGDTVFSICQGEDADLNTGASGNVQWYSDELLSNLMNTGANYTLIQPQNDLGLYVTQAEGICISPPSIVQLIVDPLPGPISIEGPDLVCEGSPVLFSVIGEAGLQFEWITPTGPYMGQQLEIAQVVTDQSGTYTVVPSLNGCPGDPATFIITVLVPIPIDLGPDTTFCEGGEFQIVLPPGNSQQLWSTGSNGTSITVTTGGTFSVSAVDEQGCLTHGMIEMATIFCDLDIPNVFTPNGDGINDTWWLGSGPYTKASLIVYNRWGNLVWEGDVTRTGFNGRNYRNGEQLSEGTYFYVLQLERSNGEPKDKNGYFEILH